MTVTKVNTDPAIFQASNCYFFAFAARNHKGELLEARSSCKQGHINPECAETMGIQKLSWVKDKGMTDVIIETDCFVAVQAIRSAAQLLSYFGRLIQQCKMLLEELKNKGVILRFVKRSANNLAHTLASCSYSIAERVWVPGVVYPELINILENDLK